MLFYGVDTGDIVANRSRVKTNRAVGIRMLDNLFKVNFDEQSRSAQYQ